MKNAKLPRVYLIISGLLLTVIEGASLVQPVAFKATAGIDLAGNISAINDARAYSTLLLSVAVLALAGAFNTRLRYTANLVAPLTFLALGAGRVISLIADGMPAEGLVKATVLELVLGIAGALVFAVFKTKK
ncbi:MAG: DUF4345 domain-containing protein [Bacteroidota bacterium]